MGQQISVMPLAMSISTLVAMLEVCGTDRSGLRLVTNINTVDYLKARQDYEAFIAQKYSLSPRGGKSTLISH